jgi:uncharacterized membrane protein
MELWILLLGVATGMRTMTAMAMLCWFAYLQVLPQSGWALWTASLVAVIVFTVLALGEYIGDTLPQTPSRLSPGPLTARLVFGALAGALGAHAMLEPVAGGLILGVSGALIGAYGGFYARRAAARWAGRDLPVALCGSLLALFFAFWAARTLHQEAVIEGLAGAIRGFPLMRF